MTITSQWVGGVTPTSARVVAKITGGSASLKVSTDELLAGATTFGPVTAVNSVVQFTATGLAPSTRYFYAVDDGTPGDTGQFTTHPAVGSEASFTFAVSSCAGAGAPLDVQGAVLDPIHVSNHPVFETIRNRAIDNQWLFFAHLGDFHYYNLGGPPGETSGPATVANYRRGYDDVLLQPRQHQLYRDVPLALMWDDHDYGPNNGDSTAPGRLIAQQVYRERVPSHTLAVSGGEPGVDNMPIYHSFQVGRVQFIVSDTRSNRTPNSAPDDANKTMLGQSQKTWMSSVLQTSTAEFLIWLNPTPWIEGAGSDTWSGFLTEANELVTMFTTLGWKNRMLIVGGDTHYMGIDDGSGVSIGGIPVFLFGSLDSSGGGPSSLPWSHGTNGGKGRYGTLAVVDNGDQIHLTGTGWIGSTLWRSHTVTVSTVVDPGPGPDPDPEPEPEIPITPAVPKTHVTWLGCNLVTGGIIAELPDITGSVSRVLGAHTSSSLTLPIPLGGPATLGDLALQATEPGVTMLVAVVNDVPTWGGIVLTRQGGTEGKLTLGCVSLEGYLDRRYVGDHTWVLQDEASVIAAGLVADAQVQGIGLTVDAPATGTKRNRTYFGKDDATVYSRLRELMGVDGGPEWTIDLDWVDENRQAIKKILRIRKRIGTVAAAPGAVFQTTANSVYSTRGSSEARYVYSEDYSDGRGANHVVATGSGEGEDRPQSAPATSIKTGWPRYERRFSPSNSISNVAVLDAHAKAELALRTTGARTWQISTRWDAYPKLNIDWKLGDDVAWELVGHRHPSGVLGQGRVIGWELDMQAGVVHPILWEPDGEA